jgi:uncharacterized protein
VIVRADDLRSEGLQVDLAIEPGPLSYVRDLEIEVLSASLTAHVKPYRDGLTCAGRMVAAVRVPCSRCLESYDLPVDREFRVEYVSPPETRRGREAEIHIARSDLDVGYLDEQRSVDMRGLAEEQIYLEIPMKPLCTPACRGLCTRCGGNRNRDECLCAAGAAS